jgi:DNA repair protein RecO (recombination protein O)
MHHKTAAIVLRCLDYGESDRIITFYTQELGKLKGIAKGAKRSKKRFANALEPFSCLQLLFSRRGRDTLAFIEGCDVEDHFPAIRSDLEKILIASYMVELTDIFTLEGKKNDDLFQLLQDFLGFLNSGSVAEGLLQFFEIRFLKVAGYDPVLDRCLACKTPVGHESHYMFIPREGGIRCGSCCTTEHETLSLSLGTIRTLMLGKELELAKLSRLLLSGQSVAESRSILTGFIRHLLGKDLKSLQVLRKIQELET